MAGTATNDKIIRIKSDINQAIADAHKLQSAYTSLSGVNPALAAMVNNLNGAQGATNRVGGAANAANNNVRQLTGSLGGLNQAAQAAMSRLSGMTGTMGGIALAGATLGITAVAGGLIALGTAAVQASAKMESYRASLTTVLGDANKAAMAMDRLTQFAAKTPFSLDQSVEGFIKLKALGLQPTEAAMTSYGNTASALGKDLNQMVEAVADASTGQFERLQEFGIKSKTQGDKVKFTFQGVTTSVANNSTAIQGYLMGIGNVNFAGAMEKQMATFNGAMSNLEDTWSQTLAAIGDGGLNTSVARVINMITSGITTLTPLLVGVGRAMSGIIDGVASILGGIGDMFGALNSGGLGGVTLMERLTGTFFVIGQIAQVTGAIIGGVFSAVGTAMTGTGQMITAVFGTALDWLGIKFETGGRSWSNSLFGILRAAKAVAMLLPQIFQIAVNDLLGMFSTLGQAITALLSGQWERAKELASKPLFTNTGRAINAVSRVAVATYQDEDAAERAKNRMLGRTGKKDGASLDDLAGPAPKPGAADADKDAAKKAAERANREAEYWQALKDQLATASMLTNQAEIYNKQLELRKIVERDLTDAEKSRVATALGEINTAKALTSLKQRAFEAQNEYTVELGRAKNLTDAQKSVEDELFKARVDALNKNVDINAIAYKQEEEALRKQLEKNAALKAQNELLKKAQDFALNMSNGARAQDDLKKLDAEYQAWRDAVAKGDLADTFGGQIIAGYENAKLKIQQDGIRVLLEMSPTLGRIASANRAQADAKGARAQLADLTLSPEARKRAEQDIERTLSTALGKIAAETTREWVDQFDDLADYFGGKLGKVLGKFADGFDRIAQMMSEPTGPAGFLAKLLNRESEYKTTAQGFGIDAIGKELKDPLKSLSTGFGDFKAMFSGDLATGLVKGLTKVQAGAQVGGMVAGVGDLLGLGKGFSTGSQIGGAVGGLFGPIGSIVGSIGGGLIGSLFGSKAKYGTASLTGAGDPAISGNKGSYEKAASGAAGSVQEGLAKLAAELGGTIGSYSLAIGQYKGNWRVRDEAFDGKLNFGGTSANGLHDFGDDEAAAIAYAIENAIKDGAIKGLDPLIQKALGALGADSAIQFAKDWKAAMDDYKSLTDPITAAIDAIVGPLDTLRETMVKVGASTEDLTKIDDYRTIKLKAALKEQLSSLTDFLDQLKGEGSGISKVDQLNAKMAEFSDYQTRIANGDSSVDQAAFTALGQSIFSLAGDIYGTATSQFQDIRAMLMGTTQSLADNVTKAVNTTAGFDVGNATTSIDNTTAAIQAQAAAQAAHYQQVAASNALQESYLKQIAANTNASAAVSSNRVASNDVAYNGRYMGQTY